MHGSRLAVILAYGRYTGDMRLCEIIDAMRMRERRAEERVSIHTHVAISAQHMFKCLPPLPALSLSLFRSPTLIQETKET